MKKAICATERQARALAMTLRAYGVNAEAVENGVNVHDKFEVMAVVLPAWDTEVKSIKDFPNWK